MAYKLWLTDEGTEPSDRCCLVPSHCVDLCGHRPTFSGGAKPPGQAICLGVGRPDPWWTGSLMEKSTFIRANLSGVRVIMIIMRVSVEELL
jgi:hypothetical protein